MGTRCKKQSEIEELRQNARSLLGLEESEQIETVEEETDVKPSMSF